MAVHDIRKISEDDLDLRVNQIIKYLDYLDKPSSKKKFDVLVIDHGDTPISEDEFEQLNDVELIDLANFYNMSYNNYKKSEDPLARAPYMSMYKEEHGYLLYVSDNSDPDEINDMGKNVSKNLLIEFLYIFHDYVTEGDEMGRRISPLVGGRNIKG